MPSTATTSTTNCIGTSPRATQLRPQQSGTAGVRHVEAAGEHQVIMAERFKTKHCRTYQQTGACPYEFKCMFAHGQDELRTQSDNERDNLTSEEAVKQWQRARRLAKMASTTAVPCEGAGESAPACAHVSQAACKATLSPTTMVEPASPTSPTIPKPRSRQVGMPRTVCKKIPTATDVVVKEVEYKNLTPICAAWVSALLTPASPSSVHHWHSHSDHEIAPGAADDYFQSNGGLIG